MHIRKFSLLVSAVALVGLVFGGCGQDVGVVDRTQPNGLEKTQFEGLWYFKSTIIDSDPESGATEGFASNLEKIRWEVTEDRLVGYRSYEFQPFAEGKTDDGRDFFGSPVVAFRILKHFDIQREYSTATGVESNVIVENDFDRPWHERRYVRVDWSQNIVGTRTTFATGNSSLTGILEGLAVASYYVQPHEEADPNRPVFTEDYFDVTNVYSIEPSESYCSFRLIFNGVPRCGTANVRTRLSFKKINPSDDYESLYYPDSVELKNEDGEALVFNFDGRTCDDTQDPAECRVSVFPYDEAFGNIRTVRVAYDRERYLTRTGRVYLAGRFDLWKRSFNEDGARIPIENREPEPIVFYGNVKFPPSLYDEARIISESWAGPLNETVAYLQGMRTPEGRGDVSAFRAQMGRDMYRFQVNDCNPERIVEYAEQNGLTEVIADQVGSPTNLSVANVEEVCAAVQWAELQTGKTIDPKKAAAEGLEMAFTWQRKGDLRYNFNNYVNPIQASAPWGAALVSQDPETGEFISSAANYYSDTGDKVAQAAVDRIQWLNGDLTAEELMRGDFTRNAVVSRRTPSRFSIRRDFVKASRGAHKAMVREQGASLFTPTTSDAEQQRAEAMFGGTDIERDVLLTDEVLRAVAGPAVYQPLSGTGLNGFSSAGFPEGVGGLGSTPESLVNLIQPGSVSPEAIKKASPVYWNLEDPEQNPFEQAAYELGREGYDAAEFFDLNYSGLAESFKGQSREEIWNQVRTLLFNGVQAHEVGHALGLRHNFQASMDPINYRREFWEEGFWNDPSTPEQPNRGAELKYASLMDYHFDVPQEGFYGVGPYDEAAIRFIYGQLVDVWDPEKVSLPDPRKYGSFARRCGQNSDFWGLPGLLNYLQPEQIPQILSVDAVAQTDACKDNYDADQSCDSPMDRIARQFVERIEANAVGGDSSDCAIGVSDLSWMFEQIAQLRADRTDLVFGARTLRTVEDLIDQELALLTDFPEYDDPSTAADESRDGLDSDNDGRVDDKGFSWGDYLYQVDYGYCSDRYAGFSDPRCQRWDTGWDFLEMVQSHAARYEREYVFDHFRRDRTSWYNPFGYMTNLIATRLRPMANVYRFYLFTEFLSSFDAPLYEDWEEATLQGINFMERIIQTPEPGTYCLQSVENRPAAGIDRESSFLQEPDKYVPAVPGQPCESPLEVGLGYGEGRYLDTAWTNEYFYKENRVGAFWDKLAAITQLTSSNGRFIRDASGIFNRAAYTIGYQRSFLDQIVQRFGSLISGDHWGYRSRVMTDENGERYVRYTPFFDEVDENGAQVRPQLVEQPVIEPNFSWSLQYYALFLGMSRWSSLSDNAPEFYRFTQIAIRGTPEDVEYQPLPDGTPVEMVEFTDPETLVTYRAPVIIPQDSGLLIQNADDQVNNFFGDAWHRERGASRDWGIGAQILTRANQLKDEYDAAKVLCDGAGNDPQSGACQDFQTRRLRLNEQVGFIDIVRKFNLRAEGL